jgi:hypothetical protein
MVERSAKGRMPQRQTDLPVWRSALFWDEVEYEIEALDPYDLLEFLTADERPISPRPGFRAGLRAELTALVRRRYQQ